jgi:STE24 endopeptidase
MATRDDSSAALRDAAVSGAGPARDYLAELRATFTPENRRYERVRQALAFADPVIAIIISLLLLFTGLAAAMRDLAVHVSRRHYVQMLVMVTLVMVAFYLLEFPLTLFRDFIWEHRFGLSTQNLAAWLADEGKGLALAWILYGGTGLIALGLWVVRRAGRRWWVWLGAGTLPLLLAGALLQPLVFEPAFNRFTPLRDQELRREILALAAKAGIPGRRVLQADRSRQTRTINAYVSGFGPSQRIVLWDTTLELLKRDEILVIMGHEMGHYRLAHIWKGVALFSALSFGIFFACDVIVRWMLRRWGRRWRVDAPHDPAALPVFAAALSVVLIVAQPIGFAYSRRIESEADTFALEVTHDNDAAARAFLALGRLNRSDPDPPAFVKLMLYTHPTLTERVRRAMTYRPWAEGKPNRLFHSP